MTETGAPPRGRWLRRATGWPAAGGLLLAFAVLALTSSARKSNTFDEIAHLTAGYSYWALNDYRLHPENGNLPQRLVALPVYLGRYRFPSLEQPAWQISSVYDLGHQFFFEKGNDVERMLLRGRSMIVLLAMALGLAVYLWSRRLYGPVGATLSLTLFAFDPHLLAHGRLMTSDVTACLFFLLSMGGIWAVLHRLGPVRLLMSCAAVAALFLSKMSAVLVVPMALILAVVRLLRGRPYRLDLMGRTAQVRGRFGQAGVVSAVFLVHAAVVILAIWTCFGFRYSAFHANRTHQDRFEGGVANLLGAAGPMGASVEFARSRRLLPEAYLYGFSFAVDQAQRRVAFLGGERSAEGWPGFFPYAFAVKTSEGLFVVLLLAIAAGIRGRRSVREGPHGVEGAGGWDRLYRAAPLWVLLGVYWGFAISSHLNIGHRHILPTYPPMFILAGAAAAWTASRPWTMRFVLAGAVGLVMTTSLLIWPDYLAYFNLLSGGPSRGHRHLVDSSLDWGQDLPALRRWLDRHRPDREGTPVYLSYFGTSSPDHYGIRAKRLPGFFDKGRRGALFPLEGGVYCISASMLRVYAAPRVEPWDRRQEATYQELLERFRDRVSPGGGESPYGGGDAEIFDRYRLARLCAHLRGRPPDDQAGHSILIYRLTDEEVWSALEGGPPFPDR